MKQKDITKEVIELSKEIAELWRMEIYEGDWVLFGTLGGVLQLIDSGWKEHLDETGYGDDYVIPIPDITDCESKLKELGFVSLQILINSEIKPTCVIWGRKTDTYEKLGKAKTSHLALLSALLEVLKK